MTSYTRGNGILEKFLTEKRAQRANSFIKDLHRKGRILDIGCGKYPFFLLSTNFNEKFGIDPFVEKSKVGSKNVTLLKTDVTKQKLPFPKNYFNTITMLAVFEHIDRKELMITLTDIKRVLKENGILIITTPAPWADKVLYSMSKFGLISKDEMDEHKHHISKNEIENMIIKSGFKSKNVRSGFFELYMNMWFTAIK